MVDTGWNRVGREQRRSANAELEHDDGDDDNGYERAEREGHRWCRHDRTIGKITHRGVARRRTVMMTWQLEQGVRMRCSSTAGAGRRHSSRGEHSDEKDSDGSERGESSKHCWPYLGAELSAIPFNGTARDLERDNGENHDSQQRCNPVLRRLIVVSSEKARRGRHSVRSPHQTFSRVQRDRCDGKTQRGADECSTGWRRGKAAPLQC